MRLRKFIIDAVLATLAIVLVGVTVASLWPIKDAAELSLQSKIVEFRMKPRLALHGIEMDIEVTDATLMSRYLRRSTHMKEWWKGGAADELLSAMGSETAAFALDVKFLGRCKVYLASQNMVMDGPIARLGQLLGSSSLAWRVVATHEAAHCFEKPASWVVKSTNFETAEAQNFLSEAFADAYVIGDLWLQDSSGANRAAKVFKEFRSGMESPAWRTDGAISTMAEKLQNTWPIGMNAMHSAINAQGVETEKESELIKVMAKDSAQSALSAHLKSIGLPACQLTDRMIECDKPHSL